MRAGGRARPLQGLVCGAHPGRLASLIVETISSVAVAEFENILGL